MATAPRHLKNARPAHSVRRGAASAQLQRAPRPERTPARPERHPVKLRVLPGGAGKVAARPSKRSSKSASAEQLRLKKARMLLVSLGAVMVAFIVFGLVLLNIYVAQSSFRINDLQSKVSDEQALYRRMRYQVAKQESPSKVAEVAGSLGMVVPGSQEYIVGPPGQSQIASKPNDRTAGSAQGVKAVMGARP